MASLDLVFWWHGIVRNPPTWQKEQCDTASTSRARKMCRAGLGTRPACATPIGLLLAAFAFGREWKAFELESFIDRHNAIDLPVGMRVILAGEERLCLTVRGRIACVEVDSRDGEEERLGCGVGDLERATALRSAIGYVEKDPRVVVAYTSSSILYSIELTACQPAFAEALLDERAQVLVMSVTRAVGFVQTRLKGKAGSSGWFKSSLANVVVSCIRQWKVLFVQILNLREEFVRSLHKCLRGGVFGKVKAF